MLCVTTPHQEIVMPEPATSNQRPATNRRPRGAPKGNLNALKTGRSSKQLQQFVERLFKDPELLHMFRVFLGNPDLRKAVTIRGGETYLRQLRRSKERERRRLRRTFEWLPYYDEDEAPWSLSSSGAKNDVACVAR
jgi:hypothetical protein